nr:MAG TPA: hypothetical protein [Caudoviricetes sp.]
MLKLFTLFSIFMLTYTLQRGIIILSNRKGGIANG